MACLWIAAGSVVWCRDTRDAEARCSVRSYIQHDGLGLGLKMMDMVDICVSYTVTVVCLLTRGGTGSDRIPWRLGREIYMLCRLPFNLFLSLLVYG